MQVQEVASSHGRPQIPANNAQLQEYNSTHGHAHTHPPHGNRPSLTQQNSASGIGSRTSSFTLDKKEENEAIGRSQQVPFAKSFSSHGVSGETAKKYTALPVTSSALGAEVELVGTPNTNTSSSSATESSKQEAKV